MTKLGFNEILDIFLYQYSAILYANSSPEQTHSAPRDCANPGLYFGFLAGYQQAIRDIKSLEFAEKEAKNAE